MCQGINRIKESRDYYRSKANHQEAYIKMMHKRFRSIQDQLQFLMDHPYAKGTMSSKKYGKKRKPVSPKTLRNFVERMMKKFVYRGRHVGGEC